MRKSELARERREMKVLACRYYDEVMVLRAKLRMQKEKEMKSLSPEIREMEQRIFELETRNKKDINPHRVRFHDEHDWYY